MPRTIKPSPELLALLRRQDLVATTEQLMAGGLSRRAVDNRVQRGQWHRLLPGIVLTSPSAPSRRQLLVAAWLWTERKGAIDGLDACAWHGLQFEGASRERVHAVAPADSPARSRDFVVVRRALAEIRIDSRGIVPYVDIDTAVLIAARGMESSRSAIAILSRALQSGRVTEQSLVAARQCLGDKWCRRLDSALVAVGIGVRSPLENDNRVLLGTSTVLPEPLWNQWLDLGDGLPWVCADALWEEAGMVEEVLGRKYHAWAEQFEQTEARRARMIAAGLVVQGATRQHIRTGGPLLARLERTYIRNAGGGMPAGVRLVSPPAIAR